MKFALHSFDVWFSMQSSMDLNLNLLEVEYPTDRRKKFMKYPLDHVYYRELKVKQTDVLPSLEGSDHNAISVIFDII